MKSQSLENIVNTHSLGICDYETLWEKMKRFTKTRNKQTMDEIWFTEHPPIYTLGINADRRHLLSPDNIPVLQIDRGGQVTYHGPGQLMIYPLINLKRANLTEPFTRINPCGFSDLKITNLREIGISLSHDLIKSRIKKNLLGYLGMREKQIH